MTTMTNTSCQHTPTAGRPAARGIVRWLLAANAVYHSRRALAHLDAATLIDIGLSVDEARAEAKRPIWDVPTSCLR